MSTGPIGQIRKFNFNDSEWIVTKIEEKEFNPKETWTVEIREVGKEGLQAIGTIRLFDGGYSAQSHLLGVNSLVRQTIRRCVEELHDEWWSLT